MPVKRKKVIDHKTYKRWNGYATRGRAQEEVIKLKDGMKDKDGFQFWYEHARIVIDHNLKTRKFVVWVHGKQGDRRTKGAKGKIKKGKTTRKSPTTYKPRTQDAERSERVKKAKHYLDPNWW